MTASMQVKKVDAIPASLETKTLYLYQKGDGRSNAAVADASGQRVAVFHRDIRLKGPKFIVQSQPGSPSQAQYIIQNFSSFLSYQAEISAGSVSIENNIVTVTAPETTGTIYLKINGEYSPIQIADNYLLPPAVLYPEAGANDVLRTFSALISPFELASDGTDVCQWTIWQLSDQPDFSTIITSLMSPGESPSMEFFDLTSGVTYYVRAAYVGETYGQSDWSAVRSFTISTEPVQYIEGQKITFENGDSFERSGSSIAVSSYGSELFIGASSANGANSITGEVTVYENNDVWQPILSLNDPDGLPADAFGGAMALSGNDLWLAISARQDDEIETNAGSVFLYEKVEGFWEFRQKLNSPAPTYAGNFGSRLTFSNNGTRLLISERNATNNEIEQAGAVHLFVLAGGEWLYDQTIFASDPEAGAGFGESLKFLLGTDYVLVGAPFVTNNGNLEGAVYLFENQAGFYNQIAKIFSPSSYAGQRFGFDITADATAEHIVISAPWPNPSVSQGGSLYVFDLTESSLTHIATIGISTGVSEDYLGYRIEITPDGELLVATAPGVYEDKGMVYVFSNTNDVWSLHSQLEASDSLNMKKLGLSLAIDSTASKIFAGSPYDNTVGPESGAVIQFTRV